jgi:energy-coupling factor transporter ATP-binding protein EcfA2
MRVGRAMKGAVSNDVSNRIAFCKRRFAYLNEQFDRTLAVRTWTAVGKQAEASARKGTSCPLPCFDANAYVSFFKDNVDLLTNLPNVHDLKAGYDWVDPCLPGTRTILLAEIESWLESYEHDDPRIMWLFGMAGMGKSTLAATAARLLEQSQRLGGTFFFSRAVAERSNPHYIFSTIASQLVTRVPKVAEGIFTALREDPGLGKSALSTQFHKLIVGPLIAAHDLSVPIVLVFDALDECTMPPAVLSIIGAEIMKLPPLFKILITSRPEQAILDLMDSMGSSVVRHGLQRDLDVDRDIEKFILKRMSDVARRFHLQSDWPGKENRKALVEKAGGLFIWISTALKFIEDEDEDDPEGQLKLILNEGGGSQMSSSPMSDLDTLYLQVLNQAFSFKASERRIGLFRKIVGAIITIKNPLTAIALGTLLDLGSTAEAAGSTVKQNIRKLQALLVVPGNKPIHTIHPSFADFLSDPSRCTDEHFYIDRKPQHYFLACQSLRLMAQMLRPNLCSVDPGLFNSEIGDLQDRISRNIPDALQYACRFWGEHLSAAEHEDELYGLVRDFYFTNLLSWIEVLSLLNDIGYAFQCLESAEHWLMVSEPYMTRIKS